MEKLVDMTWEEANNKPSKLIKKIDGFEITETYISKSYTTAKICYFVDYLNGDEVIECGSYNSIEEAEERINELKAA